MSPLGKRFHPAHLRSRESAALLLVITAVVSVAGFQVICALARASWVFDVLTSFAAYSAVGGCSGALAAVLSKRRATRLLGVAAVLFGLIPVAHQLFRTPDFAEPAPNDVTQFKVVCANVHTRNRSSGAVRQLLADEDPDLFALLEADEYWVAAAASLEDRYPFKIEIPRSDNFGLVVRSKVAFEESEVLEFDGASTPAVSCRVRDDAGRLVRLIIAHPPPPIGASLWAERNDQLRRLAAIAASEDDPLILIGDLNVTPWSPFFGDLLSGGGLTDARRHAGGMQATWPAHMTLVPMKIPIDHAVVKNLSVSDFHVCSEVGSDHLPISLTVRAQTTSPGSAEHAGQAKPETNRRRHDSHNVERGDD